MMGRWVTGLDGVRLTSWWASSILQERVVASVTGTGRDGEAGLLRMTERTCRSVVLHGHGVRGAVRTGPAGTAR